MCFTLCLEYLLFLSTPLPTYQDPVHRALSSQTPPPGDINNVVLPEHLFVHVSVSYVNLRLSLEFWLVHLCNKS